MKRQLAFLVLACTSTVLLALASPPGPAAVPARDDPKAKPEFGKNLVVYLGCGEAQGAGTVVQVDADGTVLGTVLLPGTPYGLAAYNGTLVAAVPSARKVVTINGRGEVKTLFDDPKVLPNPLSVAADGKSGDVVVADNQADVLLLIPGGEAKNARPVLQFKGFERQLQNMSVALARDGALLFGSSAPQGVFRLKTDKDAALGQPVLPADAAVAADPSSPRWVAALPNELRVFEGSDEKLKLPYPGGTHKLHDNVGFGADGTLVMALVVGQNRYQIARADFDGKAFRPLFAWNRSRVVSLAVGPRLAWKE